MTEKTKLKVVFLFQSEDRDEAREARGLQPDHHSA